MTKKWLDFGIVMMILVLLAGCQTAETAVPTDTTTPAVASPLPPTETPPPTETAVPPTPSPIPPSPTPIDVDAILNQGFGEVEAGNFANAITAAETVIAFDPDIAAAYHLLSLTYRQVGNYESALLATDQALALEPANPEYYVEQALAREGLTEFEEMLASTDRCLEIDPEAATCLVTQGVALRHLFRWQDAVDAFTQAIELEPQIDAYTLRGVAYRELGEYELAIADHTRSIELLPDYPYYHLDRAATYLAQGAPLLALDDLDTCLMLDADFPPCYFYQGEAYAALAQVATAVTAYQTYLTFVEQNDCPACQAVAEAYVQYANELETIDWGETTWTVFRGECQGRAAGNALEISTPSICYLQSQQAGQFDLETVNYVQANLRLSEHPTKRPSVNLYLVTYDDDNQYWEAGCTILDEPADGLAYTFCKIESGTLDGSANDPFFVEGPRVAFDTWHQVRTEIDPETAEHRFYFNGDLIGRYTPANPGELLAQPFRIEIQQHSGGDGTSLVSGQIDELTFGHQTDE